MRGFGALAALATVLALAGAAQAAPVHVIALSESAPPGGADDIALKHFKDAVQAGTHGAVQIRVVDGGKETPQALLEGMMFGDMDMLSSNLVDYLPLMIDEMSGLATPFLLPSQDAAKRYIASPLLDEARDKVLTSRHIRFLEMDAVREPSHIIAARRAMASPRDLAGMKITSTKPLTKGAVRLWQALGAIYVPTTPGEDLRPAFRTGRIEAAILPDLGAVQRAGLVSVAPHLIGVNDGPQIWEISINETVWQGLTADQHAALLTAAKQSGAVFETLSAKQFKAALGHLPTSVRKGFVQWDSSAVRASLRPTYQVLTTDGSLSLTVLAASDAAMSVAH